jgi:hypothetical protein
LPALAALWPRATQAQDAPRADGLHFTDDSGNADLTALADNDLNTGIEYH